MKTQWHKISTAELTQLICASGGIQNLSPTRTRAIGQLVVTVWKDSNRRPFIRLITCDRPFPIGGIVWHTVDRGVVLIAAQGLDL